MSSGEFLAFAILAVTVGLLVFSSRNSPNAQAVPEGMPLPELMAEGWLNAAGPVSREQLNGKVVVVDVWATWCPPCRAAMPELAKLYAKYQPLGVEFLGLTSEVSTDVPKIEKFISSVDGFDWPVGYGTMPMQDLLGIQVLPTVIVFGPQGQAIWSSSRLIGIEDVLDQALATVAPE